MAKKAKKIQDPAKLEEMRARMARVRAAKAEKQIQPVEATAGGSDGLNLSPVTDSPPLPAVPLAEPILGEEENRAQGDPATEFKDVDSSLNTPPAQEHEWPTYMPVQTGLVHEMRVIQIPQNPKLVICDCATSPDAKCHVDVGVNENFVIGMKLQATRKPPPQEGFWKLQGALPKFKGRW